MERESISYLCREGKEKKEKRKRKQKLILLIRERRGKIKRVCEERVREGWLRVCLG